MLDHLSDGRMILGIGRGLGRVEFEGFRIDMGESRGALRGGRRGSCSKDSRTDGWKGAEST